MKRMMLQNESQTESQSESQNETRNETRNENQFETKSEIRRKIVTGWGGNAFRMAGFGGRMNCEVPLAIFMMRGS